MNIGDEKRQEATKSPGKMIAWRGMAKGGGHWSFLLSYDVQFKGWHFSAMLYPEGRSSTKADWEYLGRIVSCVRVPQGRKTLCNTIVEEPNAIHKFTWSDDPKVDAIWLKMSELAQEHVQGRSMEDLEKELADLEKSLLA